ncbi:MAG: dephospho-CoA kinase [Bacillota bacterium]|jgi:dephospho-CoA kinase|nr:dephospho-CoA kinase [Bacillota bacterium]
MLVVGLTGGIASGKSTVSRILRNLDAEVIDSDIIAHELTRPGSACYNRIVEAFGHGFLNPDGTLNRRRLGRRVFDNRDELNRLNSILHPAVISIVQQKIDEAGRRPSPPEVLVIDAPLLIEAGMVSMVDVVWVVRVDESTQMERLIARDRLSLDEALSRIRAQMPLKDKIKFADVVIDNSGTIEETEQQVIASLARGANPPDR